MWHERSSYGKASSNIAEEDSQFRAMSKSCTWKEGIGSQLSYESLYWLILIIYYRVSS